MSRQLAVGSRSLDIRITVNWEIFAIIGTIAAVIALKPIFFNQPKEEKQALLISFKATQELSHDVSDRIYRLASIGNGWDLEFLPGITFRRYYQLLIESQSTNLSDQLYEKIKAGKLTKSIIANMQQSLNAQFTDLQKVQTAIKAVGE